MARTADERFLERTFHALLDKGLPEIAHPSGRAVAHALFVPECPTLLKRRKAPYAVYDAADVLAVLR